MHPKTDDTLDLFIIGGGINGTGIARDAAGRGLSVALCEQHDLAGAISSASSKLIHGGMCSLELGAFRTLRESLTERELLLAAAPHLVTPLRFAVPLPLAGGSPWKARAGLFLYDRLGGQSVLPRSETVALRRHALGEGLRPEFDKGFAYSDCWVDDGRLVVLNALAAEEKGATIWTRTRCVAARREGERWRLLLRSMPIAGEETGPLDSEPHEGRDRVVYARALVNAAGPWARQFLGDVAGVLAKPGLRLVKGNNIVVPRVHPGDHAFLLQPPDGRPVFVLPFEERFSIIGTTEVNVSLEDVPTPGTGPIPVDKEEVDYLTRVATDFLDRSLFPADVVWSYAGVRPLYADESAQPAATTRDHVLHVDDDGGHGPLLTVFGGKLTTHRRLSERAVERLRSVFPRMGPNWTAHARLPGGDLPQDAERYQRELARAYPNLPPLGVTPLFARHGTRTRQVLGDARTPDDLGRRFGGREGRPALFEREIAWFCEREWARTAEDVLWRRTKMGLHLSPAEREAVAECTGFYVGRDAPTLLAR